MQADRVKVIGIGNRLRGDDALGPILADELRTRLTVPIIEHTGESLSLLNHWEGAQGVILIDVVRADGDSGRIHRIDLLEEELAVSPWTFSTHAFSLAETLSLARTMRKLPESLLFFGVEGCSFGIGSEMSKEVADAVPGLVDEICREVATLESGSDPEARHA